MGLSTKEVSSGCNASTRVAATQTAHREGGARPALLISLVPHFCSCHAASVLPHHAPGMSRSSAEGAPGSPHFATGQGAADKELTRRHCGV